MHILVVEDDRKVASFIKQGLEEEDYTVDVALDGEEGSIKAAVGEYDLFVLDVMLPERSGYELAREFRREGSEVPVLMLTARDATEDVVRGLDAGADDYLTKPFAFEELLARVRSLLRRSGVDRSNVIRYEDVELDHRRHKARRGQRDLDLTPKEFQLLEYFMLHPEEVISRTELLQKVWELNFDPESNVVDVHVGNLRRKLSGDDDEPMIETVRGVGYRFG
ncbi:MAG: response regulator transcription factor [bacterium]